MTDETDRLTESARNALLKAADTLRQKFTGRIVFQCRSGGVGKFLLETEFSAEQLAKPDGSPYNDR